MTFSLPYPPTTNHAYCVRNGRKVKTDKARAYAEHVQYLVADHQRTDEQPPPDLTNEPLYVHITVHHPDNRRRDLSNTEKLVTDAVFKQLGLDDSRITLLVIERGPNKPKGALTYSLTIDQKAPW